MTTHQPSHPLVDRILDYMQDYRARNKPPYADEYAALGQLGGPRRFFVSRLGGTGSTWLAKTLNSHPDVFCGHEIVLWFVHPRKTFDVHDHYRFVECVARDNLHGAYVAAGHVGSTWLGQQIVFPKTWTTGYLVRHPLRTLNSVFNHVRAGGGVFPSVGKHEWDSISRVFGVDCSRLDPADLFFLHQADTWARAALLVKYFGAAKSVLRLEDLNDFDRLRQALTDLTGVSYADHLIERALAATENAREQPSITLEQIFQRFTEQQRAWFVDYLAPFAALLGYEILSSAP